MCAPCIFYPKIGYRRELPLIIGKISEIGRSMIKNKIKLKLFNSFVPFLDIDYLKVKIIIILKMFLRHIN